MNLRLLFSMMAIALAATFVTPASAADAKAKGKGKAPAGQPSPEDLMKAFEAMAAPTPEHKKLEARAGTWEAKTMMWMDPKAPPQENKGGKSTVKAAMDDPMTGDRDLPTRIVYRFESKNKVVMEMYHAPKKGSPEMKDIEVTYTRKS